MLTTITLAKTLEKKPISGKYDVLEWIMVVNATWFELLRKLVSNRNTVARTITVGLEGFSGPSGLLKM